MEMKFRNGWSRMQIVKYRQIPFIDEPIGLVRRGTDIGLFILCIQSSTVLPDLNMSEGLKEKTIKKEKLCSINPYQLVVKSEWIIYWMRIKKKKREMERDRKDKDRKGIEI